MALPTSDYSYFTYSTIQLSTLCCKSYSHLYNNFLTFRLSFILYLLCKTHSFALLKSISFCHKTLQSHTTTSQALFSISLFTHMHILPQQSCGSVSLILYYSNSLLLHMATMSHYDFCSITLIICII